METEKKTAADMRALLSSFEPEYPFKTGYITRLLTIEKLPIADICRKIKDIVQIAEPDRQIHVNRLKSSLYEFKKIATKKINYAIQWTDLLNLNKQTFNIPFESQTLASTPMPMQQNTPEIPAATDLALDVTNEILSVSVLSGPPSPKRLRRDCDNCVAKQRTSMNMLKENKRLRLKLREQNVRHRQERRMFSLKTLNEKIRRKTQSANLWRAKCLVLKKQFKDMQKQKELLEKSQEMFRTTEEWLNSRVVELKGIIEVLQQSLKKSRKENNCLQKKNKQCTDKTKKACKQVQDYKANLKKEKEKCFGFEVYATELEEIVEGKIVTKDEGMFNYMFRQCVYSCLVMNVSVEKVSRLLISILGTCSQKNFSKLPCVSTVAQMGYELGVLANVQVGHMLHECDVATVAWDATTIEGAHINEVSVTLLTSLDRHSKFTLSIREIASGATDHIHQHVMESLSDVIDMYCDVFKLPVLAFREIVKSKLHSTMSDRAAANHCVSVKLQEEFGALADLKCLVHPVDGLARAARESLHKLDVVNTRETDQDRPESSGKTAQGCHAAELIHQISKLRYKDGSGDPAAFRAFLEKKKMKSSTFKRYVGNRLNILFSMAAVIYHHHKDLEGLMQYRMDKSLCKQIYEGLTDPSVLLHLQVLGLYSHFLTGPWMHMFYAEGKRHFDAIKEAQICLQNLMLLETSPDDFNNKELDAFGCRMMNVEPILREVDIHNKAPFIILVKNLAGVFVKTLSQQLKPYIEGPLSNPSEELEANTASAPLHNMHAERTLGMTDSAMRRAPNATLGFIDGKVKSVQNNTLHWLQSLDEDFQKILVKYAVRRAPQSRKQQSVRQKRVKREKFQKADEGVRKKCEKQITSKFVATGSMLSVLDMGLFKSIDQVSRERLKKFVVDDGALSGIKLRHVWHEDNKEEDSVYIEEVKSVARKDKLMSVIVLWFWNESETKSKSTPTFPMTMKQFLVDFATGDLTFCSN